MYKRYYHILGIIDGASKAEVKRAYYRKAKQYHPDVNTDPKAVQRFLEVQEAFDVLYHHKAPKGYTKQHQSFYRSQRNSSYAEMKREMRREAHRKKYGASNHHKTYQQQHNQSKNTQQNYGASHSFRKTFFKEEYGKLARRICFTFYWVLLVFGGFLTLLPLVVLMFFTGKFATTSTIASFLMGVFVLRYANNWYLDLKRDFASQA